jgi:hypothetical protein
VAAGGAGSGFCATCCLWRRATRRRSFDPLQLAVKYPDMVPWFREAELKHGRMSMLAVLGMIVPAFIRVPGEQIQGS